MKVSEKYIISIRKFMTNFILVDYDEEKKLTHNYMFEYLIEKGNFTPKRANFKSIKTPDILRGTIIFVRDENGKIIPYENPLLLDEIMLMNEIKEKEIMRKNRIIEVDDKLLELAIKKRKALNMRKSLFNQNQEKSNARKLVKGRN